MIGRILGAIRFAIAKMKLQGIFGHFIALNVLNQKRLKVKDNEKDSNIYNNTSREEKRTRT